MTASVAWEPSARTPDVCGVQQFPRASFPKSPGAGCQEQLADPTRAVRPRGAGGWAEAIAFAASAFLADVPLPTPSSGAAASPSTGPSAYCFTA
jgi:hypothetical protein